MNYQPDGGLIFALLFLLFCVIIFFGIGCNIVLNQIRAKLQAQDDLLRKLNDSSQFMGRGIVQFTPEIKPRTKPKAMRDQDGQTAYIENYRSSLEYLDGAGRTLTPIDDENKPETKPRKPITDILSDIYDDEK